MDVPRAGDKEVLIATTTTTQDTGLLDVLLPAFQQKSGYSYKTIVQGTGAVLALASRGEADVVLSHAPESEKPWIAQGYGTSRRLVMYNDLIVVGPAADPAGVKGAKTAVEALQKIAERSVAFVSRGDQSGTHVRELAIWKVVGIEPKAKPWYVESGSGQGQTLTIADQRDAYAISDRGTWLSFRQRIKLGKLFEGDPELLNIYHVMPVSKEKFPSVPVNHTGGEAFADFVLSAEGQKIIDEFGRDRYGEPLFKVVGGKTEGDLGVYRG
jgi:tungstate transport system substrate-binding protein